MEMQWSSMDVVVCSGVAVGWERNHVGMCVRMCVGMWSGECGLLLWVVGEWIGRNGRVHHGYDCIQ